MKISPRLALLAAGTVLFVGGAAAQHARASACTVVCTTPTTQPTPDPAPAPTTTTTAPPQKASQPASVVGGGAARLVELANADRASAGAPPLVLRSDVSKIATGHSFDMAAKGQLFHNDAYFTEQVRASLHAGVLGENVASNSSVDDAHRRLMASPHHRANLLDPRFTVVGMAVVDDGSGTLYVTEDFVQPLAAAPAPRPAPPVVRARSVGTPVAGALPTSASSSPASAAAAATVEVTPPPTAKALVATRHRAHARHIGAMAAISGLLLAVAAVAGLGLQFAPLAPISPR